MIVLTLVDVLALMIFIGSTCDALRTLRGHREPLRTLGHVLAAVAAFATALEALVRQPDVYAVCLHLGMAIVAVLHHQRRTDGDTYH